MSELKCKFCGGKAVIMLEEYRNKVNCYECGASYYLKEQHIKVCNKLRE